MNCVRGSRCQAMYECGLFCGLRNNIGDGSHRAGYAKSGVAKKGQSLNQFLFYVVQSFSNEAKIAWQTDNYRKKV